MGEWLHYVYGGGFDGISFWDDFAEEILINGVSFEDVWYFDREGIPSLYVQKGRGIIAFAGMDEEVWVLACQTQ